MAPTPDQLAAIDAAVRSAVAAGKSLFDAGTAARAAVPGLANRDYTRAVDASYSALRAEQAAVPQQVPGQAAEIRTGIRQGQIAPVNYTVRYTYTDRQGVQQEAYMTVTDDGSANEQDILDEAADIAADDADRYAQYAAGAFSGREAGHGFEIVGIYTRE